MPFTSGKILMSIPNGGTDTPALSTVLGDDGVLQTICEMCEAVTVKSPAALTAAISLQGASTKGGVDWTTLQDRGVDIVPVAAKQTRAETGGFKDFRIHSAGAEGAQRDFLVTFHMEGR